jgi:Domain of unknown function (DUF4416)
MSTPQEPKPGKLVIGLLMKDRTLFEPLAEKLIAKYGTSDIISSWMCFDYTAYYESELGSPLYRRLMAFETLIDQQALATVKLATNRLEQEYAQNLRRRVNIDPGYLLYERFVLASGKNFSHRIYIGHCIYADLTLIYRKGAFETLPWTYPDYADQPIRSFLERVRNKYAVDLKRQQFRH